MQRNSLSAILIKVTGITYNKRAIPVFVLYNADRYYIIRKMIKINYEKFIRLVFAVRGRVYGD